MKQILLLRHTTRFFNTHFFLFALTFIATTVYPEVYTLDFLIDQAVKNANSLRKIKKEIELTELNIQKVYSSAYPEVEASVDLNHSFEQYIPYSFVQPEQTNVALENPDRINFTGLNKTTRQLQQGQPLSFEDMLTLPKNSLSTTVGVRFPIFSQGKIFLNIKINRLIQAANVCKYEEEKENVRATISKLYYRVLLKQQQSKLQNKNVQLMKEQHQVIGVQFANGNGRELDTLNSFLQLQQSMDKKDVSESERLLACEELIRECGLVESPDDVWVDGDFPEPVFFITLDETLMLLNEENRTIRQMKSQENVKTLELTLAKAALLPSVYIGGSIGRIGQFDNIDGGNAIEWGNDQRVFAGLSWTLFKGLVSKHEISSKKLEREILTLEHQEIIDALEIETISLFKKIMNLKQRIVTSERIVSIARKTVDIARKSYKTGNAALPDVYKSEMDYLDARKQHTTILFDFHTSVTDFKFLIGKI